MVVLMHASRDNVVHVHDQVPVVSSALVAAFGHDAEMHPAPQDVHVFPEQNSIVFRVQGIPTRLVGSVLSHSIATEPCSFTDRDNVCALNSVHVAGKAAANIALPYGGSCGQ